MNVGQLLARANAFETDTDPRKTLKTFCDTAAMGVLKREEMKVSYSIDKQRRLIVTTAEGSVTFGDIKGHQDRLLADPDFDVSFDQLIDTTAASAIDISAAQARVLAQRRIVSPESRRAFVATQPAIFGLGRMMQIYHEPLGPAEVFDSTDEALTWIKERGADLL